MRILYRRLTNTEPLTVVAPLTLLVVLLNAFDRWYSQVPLVLLCAAALIYPRWLKSTTFWCITTAVYASGIFLNWGTCDNHKYLICYWCLALCTVLEVPRSMRPTALAFNGRLLVGLCMLLAVFWRLASDCYHDGTFFHYAMLVDPRFADMTGWLSSGSTAALAENRQLRELVMYGHLHGVEVNRVALSSPSGARLLGHILTWWTLVFESTLAILFLWPDNRRVAVARNSLLLLFGLSTYALATVRGFGWMLMMLGLAQCGERDKHFRVPFIAMFLLVEAYLLPYQIVIDRVMGWLNGS